MAKKTSIDDTDTTAVADTGNASMLEQNNATMRDAGLNLERVADVLGNTMVDHNQQSPLEQWRRIFDRLKEHGCYLVGPSDFGAPKAG